MLSGVKFIPRDEIDKGKGEKRDDFVEKRKESGSRKEKNRRKKKKSRHDNNSDDDLERIKKRSKKSKKWYSSDEHSSEESSDSESGSDGKSSSKRRKKKRESRKRFSSDEYSSSSSEGEAQRGSAKGGRKKSKGKQGEIAPPPVNSNGQGEQIGFFPSFSRRRRLPDDLQHTNKQQTNSKQGSQSNFFRSVLGTFTSQIFFFSPLFLLFLAGESGLETCNTTKKQTQNPTYYNQIPQQASVSFFVSSASPFLGLFSSVSRWLDAVERRPGPWGCKVNRFSLLQILGPFSNASSEGWTGSCGGWERKRNGCVWLTVRRWGPERVERRKGWEAVAVGWKQRWRGKCGAATGGWV